ncbi:MAG: hypothetical protein ABSH11_07380 [Verrucomicrobiota bacterium]
MEVSKDIYGKMIANIRVGAPEAVALVTPLFGFSTEVLPEWLNRLARSGEIDFAFLNGGDDPQIITRRNRHTV